MVKHHYCSDELQWRHFCETEKDSFIKRVIDFHKPDHDLFYDSVRERKIKTCKHCMNLSQVKGKCRCKYNPLNTRIETNPHYDVDIDKFPWYKKLKPAPCAIRGLCEENSSGWISFQYYLERAESSPTAEGRLYFLAKASDLDVSHVEKFRAIRKRWEALTLHYIIAELPPM